MLTFFFGAAEFVLLPEYIKENVLSISDIVPSTSYSCLQAQDEMYILNTSH